MIHNTPTPLANRKIKYLQTPIPICLTTGRKGCSNSSIEIGSRVMRHSRVRVETKTNNWEIKTIS
jgi:hypothetical protein